MILLDTNVVSEFMGKTSSPAVIHWLDRQPRHSIWITSITVMELRFGLLAMPPGRKFETLTRALAVLLEQKIQGRIANFDVPAAERAAQLMAKRKRQGRTMDIRDTMIAGVALASHAILATRNEAHFADLEVPVVNPWSA